MGRRKKNELLAGAAGALLVISIFVASSLDHFLLNSQQYASVIAAVLVDLANGDRAGQNIGTLKISPVLTAAAQAKANDMAAKSYFAHTSPEGINPWYWFKEAGYAFQYAGENLAVDFSDSSDVNTAWMNSPTHRANIMDAHFTEIGIATAQGMYQGHPTTFVVQEFGAPAARANPIVEQAIPQNPTEPALASATTSESVLGESAPAPEPEGEAKVEPRPAPAPTVVSNSMLDTVVQAAPRGGQADISAPSKGEAPIGAIKNDYAPWWAHLMASPRQTMHYAYYLIGLLVMLALAFTTGFEIRWHHRAKAIAAGTVLGLICALFVMGDTFLFPGPKLTERSVMTASAGLSF